MPFHPTDEQMAIIEADLISQCVVACPGSGKTATAVRRLLEIRRRLGKSHGYVALFSYSNVAVETFRIEYRKLAQTMPSLSPRVLIDTVDSFVTSNIVRPHGARFMGTSNAPFLVQGTEPFLKGFTIFEGNYPHPITELQIRFGPDGAWKCVLRPPGKQELPVETSKALNVVNRLGKVGAYTHELARYWAIVALVNEPRLLGALCRKYPQILVDEAQDIGPLHGTLLSILSETGAITSLIGDPNQGIYDFAGADGSFLRDYEKTGGAKLFPLTQNRRSLDSIINVADNLAGTKSTSFRRPGERKHGAYVIRYDDKRLDDLLAAFAQILEANYYKKSEGVVVCRGNAMVSRVAGDSEQGRGATWHFAKAAVSRDRNGDIAKSFESAVSGVLRILNDPPDTLRRELLGQGEGDARVLRKAIWAFLRSPVSGIPEARLAAKAGWQPLLKQRLQLFLADIESKTALKRSPTWTKNLTTAELTNSPLWDTDLANKVVSGIRVDTVHQVKGEEFPVVLYLARTLDINKLVAGTHTEDGRIGYVAVTRASELLLVAVPKSADASLIATLETKGLKHWVGS